jgi:hypothetical protein
MCAQRFDAFLELVSGFDGMCLVEVKGGDHGIIAGAVAVALNSALPKDQLVWIGFDLDVIAALKRHLPR